MKTYLATGTKHVPLVSCRILRTRPDGYVDIELTETPKSLTTRSHTLRAGQTMTTNPQNIVYRCNRQQGRALIDEFWGEPMLVVIYVRPALT